MITFLERIKEKQVFAALTDQLIWSFGFYLCTVIIVRNNDLKLLNQFVISSTVAFILISYGRALGGEQSIYIDKPNTEHTDIHKLAFQMVTYFSILGIALLCTVLVMILDATSDVEEFFVAFFAIYVINDLARIQVLISRKSKESFTIGFFLVALNFATLVLFLSGLPYIYLIILNLVLVFYLFYPAISWICQTKTLRNQFSQLLSKRSFTLFLISSSSIVKNTGIFLALPLLGYPILLTTFRTIYTLIFSPIAAISQGINLYLLKKYHSINNKSVRRAIAASSLLKYLSFLTITFTVLTLATLFLLEKTQLGEKTYFSQISLFATSSWILGSLMISATSLGLRVSFDVQYLNRFLLVVNLVSIIAPLLAIVISGTIGFWMSLFILGIVSTMISVILLFILQKPYRECT